MIDLRQKFILFFFSIIILFLTGYAVFNYSISDPMLYNEDSLFLSFIDSVADPSLWNISERFIIFPDKVLHAFFSFFTDDIIIGIACTITSLFFLFYFILLLSVWNIKETPLYTNLTVAIFQWATLVFIVLFKFLYLPNIIVPNGYVGLLIVSFLSFFFFSQSLQQESSIYRNLCALCIVIVTFSAPSFALYFLLFPFICTLIFCRQNKEHVLSKPLLTIFILSLAGCIGFLLQYFFYPVRYTFLTPEISFLEGFLNVYAQYPFLISFSILLQCILCFFMLSPFFYSIFSLLSNTTFYIIQIVFWTSLSSLLFSFFGFLDVYTFLACNILISISFILPVYCLLFLKMCSLQFLSRICVSIVLLSILTVFFTKGGLLQNKNQSQKTEFFLCMEKALSSASDLDFALIPENIFSKIFLFSKHTLQGVPYNVETFFLSKQRKNGEIEDHKYSFLIVENKVDNFRLPNIRSFENPISSRVCGNYEIIHYNPPLVMPERTIIASYTTKMGPFIAQNIEKSISIPLPENFTLYGAQLSSLRIFSNNEKNYLFFVFPPEVNLDSIKKITTYILTDTSSGLRHFISATRREIPGIAFLLPLEEKSSIMISKKENVYTLPSGEHVAVLPITHTMGESLLFLSLAEQGKEPTVIFQYPKLPISIK